MSEKNKELQALLEMKAQLANLPVRVIGLINKFGDTNYEYGQMGPNGRPVTLFTYIKDEAFRLLEEEMKL
jgi:hypothetical protein